jgi:hypothetical protein
MTRKILLLAVALAAIAASLAGPVSASDSKIAFGFNATEIKGFRTGAVSLSGGGAVDPATGFAHTSGGFGCLQDVAQGPLSGCLAGQGVRWDTAALLSGTTFKCTGAATEALKSAATGPTTVVLQADFYRAGDGNDESFKAQVIVSQEDLAPDILGVQNVWVQGVGCGSAVGGFNLGGSAS